MRPESDLTANTSDLAERFAAFDPSERSIRRSTGCTHTRRAPTLDEIDRGEVDE
jgi:hypothetical protein